MNHYLFWFVWWLGFLLAEVLSGIVKLPAPGAPRFARSMFWVVLGVAVYWGVWTTCAWRVSAPDQMGPIGLRLAESIAWWLFVAYPNALLFFCLRGLVGKHFTHDHPWVNFLSYLSALVPLGIGVLWADAFKHFLRWTIVPPF